MAQGRRNPKSGIRLTNDKAGQTTGATWFYTLLPEIELNWEYINYLGLN